jgi:NADPH-dependent curcumin reductase
MEGFLVFDHEHRTHEAVPRLAQWVREGKLGCRDDILDALDTAPTRSPGFYGGENLAKRLIKL